MKSTMQSIENACLFICSDVAISFNLRKSSSFDVECGALV